MLLRRRQMPRTSGTAGNHTIIGERGHPKGQKIIRYAVPRHEAQQTQTPTEFGVRNLLPGTERAQCGRATAARQPAASVRPVVNRFWAGSSPEKYGAGRRSSTLKRIVAERSESAGIRHAGSASKQFRC